MSGTVSWWANSADDVVLRNCLFDDVYTFAANGDYTMNLQSETWTEAWQGGADSCTAPVAPHDGMPTFSYTYDSGTGALTVEGMGAFIGIAKAYTGGELTTPGDAPANVTYNVVSVDDTSMTVEVDISTGFWTYQLTKVDAPVAATLTGSWVLEPAAGAIGVGPEPGDVSWWANSADDVTGRSCLFDDVVTFVDDGSYLMDMQTETWTEAWQGGADSCTAPVAPHDGAGSYTYTYDAGTGALTIDGIGGHMGVAKAFDGGELAAPGDAPASVAYNVVELTDSTLVVEVNIGTGFWTYRYARPI